ncbi:MAG: hypothetical protein CMJ39_02020 [Phycisphaerae bacterium]|nr:hypothetical protein [Phycisphaerae bacterium]|tara:strand:- start:368 stop:1909 length:1542 start_codon:yes stop_codon:yes gene_type:complete
MLMAMIAGCAMHAESSAQETIEIPWYQTASMGATNCCTYSSLSWWNGEFSYTQKCSTYAGSCMGSKRGAFWHFDLSVIPEDASILYCHFKGQTEYPDMGGDTTVGIRGTTGSLNNTTAYSVINSPEWQYNGYFWGGAFTFSLPAAVVESAREDGMLTIYAYVSNSGGVDIHNTGVNPARLSIVIDTPPVIGACCMSLGQCLDGLSEEDCSDSGGTWRGDDSSCGLIECEKMEYAQLHHRIVGGSMLSTGEPSWTVDVFAAVAEGDRVEAVAGNSLQQKMISSTYGFYQDSYGGPTSKDINPAFYPFAPDLHLDSRVTIGALDMTGDPFDGNNLGDVGINWDIFESGGDLSVGNGTWYVLADDEQGASQPFISQDCSEQHGVRIARLTAMGLDSTIMVEALVQGRDLAGEPWQDLVDYTFTYEEIQDCNGNQVSDTCDIANGYSQDQDGNGIPDECDNVCEGDVDGDADADVDDLLLVIGSYGMSGDDLDADLDGDGDVDVDDLLSMLNYFGGC